MKKRTRSKPSPAGTRKQRLVIGDAEVIAELNAEAKRQGCSISLIAQACVELALPAIRKMRGAA